MFGFLKQRRRRKLLAAPFPAHWREIVEKNVRYYACLPPADRTELEELVTIFVAEKVFEGCGGLELSDEIKLTIAAQACLLLLHRETDVYPKLVTILVYPNAYVAKNVRSAGGPIVHEEEQARLGESWTTGVVVLSWHDVVASASDIHDGQNVVLHEFAHQLDGEDGLINGTPLLEQRSQYLAWGRVLSAEFERLIRDSRRGRRTVLDEYGATDPAEFFAVATETFFERPRVMRKRHPELYEELKTFYRQDPAQLLPEKAEGEALEPI
jgi:Mlc titration factor MtfA (ptsG expression regulator)